METVKFGKYLKELRESKKLMKKEVANKLNVKEKDIETWEREKDYPDLRTIYKLANLYLVTETEMLKVRENSQRRNSRVARFLAKIVRI